MYVCMYVATVGGNTRIHLYVITMGVYVRNFATQSNKKEETVLSLKALLYGNTTTRPKPFQRIQNAWWSPETQWWCLLKS